MLEVEGLEVRYGAVRAVRGASFSVARGELVALLGANGAGKSSTLMAIAGRGAAGGRQRAPRRRRGHRGAARAHGAARRRHGARDPRRVPRPHGGGEPAARRVHPPRRGGRGRPGPRALPRALPDPGGARRPAGGDAVRRRAADAGDRPGDDGAPARPAARRAVARPRAGGGRPGLRDDRRPQGRGPHHPARRAERPQGAGGGRPRLRHAPRPDRGGRARAGARHRGRAARRSTWAATHEVAAVRHRRALARQRLRADGARPRHRLRHPAAGELRLRRADHGRRLHHVPGVGLGAALAGRWRPARWSWRWSPASPPTTSPSGRSGPRPSPRC